MIPKIKRKPSESKHRCPICDGTMDEGELVIYYLHSSFRGNNNYRYGHLDCWLSEKADALVETNEYLRKKVRDKIKRDKLLREV